MYTGIQICSDKNLSQISMVPHWFVTFLFPACIALLIVQIIKEYLFLEAIVSTAHNEMHYMVYIFVVSSPSYSMLHRHLKAGGPGSHNHMTLCLL